MEYGLVAVWLAMFASLGLVALPLTTALLSPLDLDGAGFAVSVGTTVITLVSFWLGHVAFGLPTVLSGVVVLGGLSFVALRSGVTVSVRRYGEATLVFGLVFGFAVAVRALNPQLHVWTEGYLNYGLVRSILRASTLPPEDFWFAGRPAQYYYGGHLSLSAWAFLTGTPARYLPNVGLAGTYAMLLTGAYELAGTLGARRGGSRRLAGALGAGLLGLASTLLTPIRLLVEALPSTPARWVRETLSLRPELVSGGFSPLAPTRFGFTNTDFPMYSLLVQSFHAHVMSQPLTLVLCAVLCAYFLTPADRRRRRLLRLGAAVPVVGVVAFTNTWSLPMAGGLVALAVAFGPSPATLLPERYRPSLDGAVRREAWRYAAGLVGGGLATVGGLLSVAPFVLATDTSRPLGFLPDRSSVAWFVVGYGLFLAAFALLLWPRLRRRVAPTWWVGPLLALAVAGYVLDFLALAFVAPVLLSGWWLLRRSDVVGYETVLVVAGAGLALLVEVMYVRAGAEPGRLNTGYKVFSQVWLLWSVAAGAALAAVLAGTRSTLASALASEGSRTRLWPGLRAAATVGVVVVLLGSASLYAVFAVGPYVTDDYSAGDGPTLDATRFLEVYHGDQAPAIAWLADRPGRPVVVAAAPRESDLYRFNAAAPSSLTGLPTVVGYSHAADYHSVSAYEQRRRHVRAIYEGSNAVRADLLARYDVRYVYVGPYERTLYDVTDLSSQSGISLAYEGGRVRVYAVNQTALSAASAAGGDGSAGSLARPHSRDDRRLVPAAHARE